MELPDEVPLSRIVACVTEGCPEYEVERRVRARLYERGGDRIRVGDTRQPVLMEWPMVFCIGCGCEPAIVDPAPERDLASSVCTRAGCGCPRPHAVGP